MSEKKHILSSGGHITSTEIEVLANLSTRGLFGHGQERVDRLKHLYPIVQSRVNYMLGGEDRPEYVSRKKRVPTFAAIFKDDFKIVQPAHCKVCFAEYLLKQYNIHVDCQFVQEVHIDPI